MPRHYPVELRRQVCERLLADDAVKDLVVSSGSRSTPCIGGGRARGDRCRAEAWRRRASSPIRWRRGAAGSSARGGAEADERTLRRCQTQKEDPGGTDTFQSTSNAPRPATPRAVDDALHASTAPILERLHHRQRAEPPPGGLRRLTDRMFARTLERAHQPQRFALGRVACDVNFDERHASGGDGGRLVEHDHVDLAGGLEDLGTPDEDAELRTSARSHQQRSGRREPECAGTR